MKKQLWHIIMYYLSANMEELSKTGKTSNRIVSAPVKIQAGYLPHKSYKCHHMR